MSPTQRSLKYLRDAGWLVAITERWNPYARVRQDLFGFGDLLAVKGDEALLVQTTSGSNASARVAKIQSHPNSAIWLSSPSRRIVVHGWAKRGARGERKTWTCKETDVTL